MMAEIIARLKAQAGSLKQVEGAVELAALIDQNIVPTVSRRPAAYVVPLSDQGGRNILTRPAVRQKITVRFGVLTMLGNVADPRGEASSIAIEAQLAENIAALLGWKPAATDSPVIYTDGRLAGFRSGVVIWLQRFTTGRHISGQEI